MTPFTLEFYKLDVLNGKFTRLANITTYRPGISWSEELNKVGGLSFSLNINDVNASKINLQRYSTHIAVKENSTSYSSVGKIHWFGMITNISGSYEGLDGDVNVEANTYLHHFGSRYTPSVKDYFQVFPYKIMQDLIATSQNTVNGGLLITNGTQPINNIPKDRTYFYGKISELLTSLANVNGGCDFTLDPVTNSFGDVIGVQFNTYDTLSLVRTDLSPLEIGVNVQSIDFETKGEIYNHITAVGGGSNETITEIQPSEGSQAIFTKRETIIALKDIIRNDTLKEETALELSKRSSESYSYKVKLMPSALPLYGSYRCGEIIKVKFQKNYIDFDGYAKIKKISCTLDAEGVLYVTPELEIL